MESSSVQILHMPKVLQSDNSSSLGATPLTASRASGVRRSGPMVVLDATETGAVIHALPLPLEPDELEHLGARAFEMAAAARARIAACETTAGDI
ncbi:hypothetical protein [Methylobacterium sp. B1]|uniref:hypothetical protein n=1 Tax=Methylobacterium sp. B1 TaxID=91459 RepID=UPI0016511472|nr:hypothetical protein [Methylobacterium sp. B1]